MPTTYRVRIDLDDVTPPIWREVSIGADKPLPVLHCVLQEAMGWMDSHLHAFRRTAAGGHVQAWQESPDVFEPSLPEAPSVQEEAEATVADLLPGKGARATYLYDFGDGWEHSLTVVEVTDEAADDDAAHVVDGERAGPPEDCGGAPGYMRLRRNLTALAQDPDADLEEGEREVIHLTFGSREPARILALLDRFDVRTADARVRAVTTPLPAIGAPLSQVMAEAEARGSVLLTRMAHLARLDHTNRLDPDAYVAMMDPLIWFLRHTGTDGLRLTSAGYLRPADVAAVAQRLQLHQEGPGAHNRESYSPRVTEFRETVQALGLARKAKGALSLTTAGKSLMDNPVALWRHVVGRLPLGRTEFDRACAMVMLLDLAGQPVAEAELVTRFDALEPAERSDRIRRERARVDHRLADAVSALGWRTDEGLVDGLDVRLRGYLTLTVLRRCGVLPHSRGDLLWTPTAHGRELLIAALRA
ncbi:plasmid pRiA4b ORF-3 family protein [Pseudactinotalea sp. Z1748]|uniref:plasmid pRiA4b ORF-3 family protein n=1 Tax=Pseudactinotalea sp. Z1748 TaxID=3413027 RepID=UPI003C7DDC40